MNIHLSHRFRRHAPIARKLVAPVGVASVLALATAPVGASTAPLVCGAPFDPYAYTQAAVSACGYQTFPLAAVRALPGGGSSYKYRVNGATVRFYVPPANFDPRTAAAAKLNEYGFPSRPTGHAALSRWRTHMSGWKGAVTPPPFLAESHTSADSVLSEVHSGYAVSGSDGTYTHAEAWYIQPTFYSSRCSTNAEATWAGLGGYNGAGNILAQDGTLHGSPGFGDGQAFWELCPVIQPCQ